MDGNGLIIQSSKEARAAIEALKRDPIIGEMISELDNRRDYFITLTDVPQLGAYETGGTYSEPRNVSGCSPGRNTPATFTVQYNVRQATRDLAIAGYQTRHALEETVAHELGHAWAFQRGWERTGVAPFEPETRETAVFWQNVVRGWNFMPQLPGHL